MRGRLAMLRTAWRRTWTAMWFLPALIVLASMVLASVLIWLEPSVGSLRELSPRLFAVSPEGARGVLTAIGTSLLGVAGVVFSITIATLALTSQQFSSRVLRTFMTDRGSQVVLGAFLGGFAYTIVVLRTVRSPDEEGGGYVPEMALLGAVGMALLGVGVLLYFISHIATSIQASQVVARIAGETIDVIERLSSLYDEDDDSQKPEGKPLFDVTARKHGYVRTLDISMLGGMAADHGWIVYVRPATGAFVVEDDVLLEVYGANDGAREGGAREREALRRAVALDVTRDVYQDPSFGVRQLVDVALRALSPGVNDTTTAVMCVDNLGAVLHAAALQPRSGSTWRDDGGQPRVRVSGISFEGLLAESFDQIREHGAGNVAIVRRLMDVAEHLEGEIGDRRDRAALAWQVERLQAEAQTKVSSDEDRQEFAQRGERLAAALQDETGGFRGAA